MNVNNQEQYQSNSLTNPDVAQYLIHYHKEVYTVILGLGLGIFAQNVVTGAFEGDTFQLDKSEWLGLIFFLPQYLFFAYDWVAYSVL